MRKEKELRNVIGKMFERAAMTPNGEQYRRFLRFNVQRLMPGEASGGRGGEHGRPTLYSWR